MTVLTYRNRASGPDSITSVAAHALGSAARTGIAARLAAETTYLGPTPVQRRQTVPVSRPGGPVAA